MKAAQRELSIYIRRNTALHAAQNGNSGPEVELKLERKEHLVSYAIHLHASASIYTKHNMKFTNQGKGAQGNHQGRVPRPQRN